jgi:hypothetical protein
MLRISQDPWAAGKLGLQILSAQQRFLNKKNKPRLKSPNTEVKPVPSADIFDTISYKT